MRNWSDLPKKVQEKMLDEQFLQNGKYIQQGNAGVEVLKYIKT
jgi:hypothetical protein